MTAPWPTVTSTYDTVRPTHDTIAPAILYFGTPVCLISSLNPDGSTNLMPMSSIYWLGQTAVLGVGARSQTAQNLQRSRECVLNLPSADLVAHVDRLALTTGSPTLSARKVARGYRFEPDKFAVAGLTPTPSTAVRPDRVAQCPVQLEGRVTSVAALGGGDVRAAGALTVEVAVELVHVDPAIRTPGTAHRIDPDRWRPLIMSFQHFYGLGPRLHPSALATIDEDLYR